MVLPRVTLDQLIEAQRNPSIGASLGTSLAGAVEGGLIGGIEAKRAQAAKLKEERLKAQKELIEQGAKFGRPVAEATAGVEGLPLETTTPGQPRPPATGENAPEGPLTEAGNFVPPRTTKTPLGKAVAGLPEVPVHEETLRMGIFERAKTAAESARIQRQLATAKTADAQVAILRANEPQITAIQKQLDNNAERVSIGLPEVPLDAASQAILSAHNNAVQQGLFERFPATKSAATTAPTGSPKKKPGQGLPGLTVE